MTLSKCITAILGWFCGLALQFQAGAAHAQQEGEVFEYIGGYHSGVLSNQSHDVFMFGKVLYSSPLDVSFDMQGDGNLVLWNQAGGAIWVSTVGWHNCGSGQGTCNPTPECCWSAWFQTDGNLVIYWFDFSQPPTDGSHGTPVWASNTWAGGAWAGSLPGAYLAVQDNGDLVIYDADQNQLWAASWQSNYDHAAQQVSAHQCGC